ncbi:uncharacterized protein A4U43_C01F35030 [Asparagus officinalis]|uniref:WRKY domain-containing protein n=1 Tax=Asparagus officinalis TaxID=4686 RepID=A0A5P1FUG7_ASPOF|nr:probable WRKY transcription factor 2 isoform X2 [Asparagus officinalis]ONK81995.1 uncharacterized protein A4U43_C01F35030 [Asparagus officinalis]
MPLSPSHKNFFSNLMAEEFDPDSSSNGNDLIHKDEKGDDVRPSKPTSVNNGHKPSLTERRAARAGFSAPKIDTDQIRAANFASSSSEIHSPYLTIPPGLSPTTLLDSPIFLSNALAQPSPTTGTYSFSHCNTDSYPVVHDHKAKDHPLEGINSLASDVKLLLVENPSSFSGGGSLPASTFDHHHSLNLSETKLSTDNLPPNQRLSKPTTTKEHSPPLDNSQEEEKGESSLGLGSIAEDGYNWRKYGQKHVKGSEYPRSYYKCTHASCPVKKKVERNHEGQVTEIIYKGAHNHPKPAQNRRAGVLSSHPYNEYQCDGSDWRNDGGALETTPPPSGINEFGENQEGGEVSSMLSNEDEERVAHGGASVGCDGEGEETESKRRKVDACAMEMSASSRAVREPRVVVQTTSEVDILDDGYRWRKYGQKVVKGNPNPRSYYKCTNPGCSVRKHVERASHDLKSVITTYEGKHNHEVPVARGSTNGSSTSANPTSAPHSTRAPENFTRYINSNSSPLGAYCLHSQDLVAPMTANFSFGVRSSSLTVSGFGAMTLPSDNAFMGEIKEEPSSDAASVYYQQLMRRMPLGPQM